MCCCQRRARSVGWLGFQRLGLGGMAASMAASSVVRSRAAGWDFAAL